MVINSSVLCIILLLFIPSASAGEKKVPINVTYSEGVKAIKDGYKEQAWSILFPLAKQGHIRSMYELGIMLLNSPEYTNHLGKAEKFFKIAASKGDVESIRMVETLSDLKASKQKVQTFLNQTVGHRSIDTREINKNRDKAKADYYKQAIKKGLIKPEPELNITLFIDRIDKETSTMAMAIDNYIKDSGGLITADYVLLIRDLQNTPLKGRQKEYEMPSSGLLPDWNGERAHQWAVKHYPAMYVTEAGNTTEMPTISAIKARIQEVKRRRY